MLCIPTIFFKVHVLILHEKKDMLMILGSGLTENIEHRKCCLNITGFTPPTIIVQTVMSILILESKITKLIYNGKWFQDFYWQCILIPYTCILLTGSIQLLMGSKVKVTVLFFDCIFHLISCILYTS